MQIEPQWIDYNGHLNMAYYNVMFDRAIDQFWLELGIGPDYMKERHGSTFTAECHVRYLREIHLGDPVQVSVLLIAADEKRLHTFEELRHATEGWLSATSENMTHPYRHGRAQDRALSARHPRPHRRRWSKPTRRRRGPRASAGSGDALEVRVEPAASDPGAAARQPTTAETRNSTTAMKKMILAISIEAPAMPPKPRMPAISAMTRNVTTQPSMVNLCLDVCLRRRGWPRRLCRNNLDAGTMVPAGTQA